MLTHHLATTGCSRADSAVALEEPETVSVQTVYTLHGVAGVAIFEIDV